MSALLQSRRLREVVHCMPELTTEKLATYEDWRLAHLLLVTITSGYLWSGDPEEAPLILPRNLCTPLMAVSKRLGMPPVICHGSACLANWNLIDPSEPFSPDNLRLNAFIFLESRANHWFFVVTAQIEKDFAPCIYDIVRATYFSKENSLQYIENALHSIQESLTKATLTMKRLPEHLTPSEFFHQLRPFLLGYNEGSLKQNGIIFEGMESQGPLRCSGASAAQSSTLQLIDAFLRVEHSGDERKFLTEQREYMPREHRELIQWIEKESPVRKTAQGRQQALDALLVFRSVHLNTVALYILTQINGSATATGTGGTSFMKFLKKMLAHILSLLRLAYISCVRPILEYDTTMFSPSTIYQPQPSQARNSKEGER